MEDLCVVVEAKSESVRAVERTCFNRQSVPLAHCFVLRFQTDLCDRRELDLTAAESVAATHSPRHHERISSP